VPILFPCATGRNRLSLVADIGGAFSTIGLPVLAILRDQRLIDFDATRNLLVIGVVSATLAAAALLTQGAIRYFSFAASFRRRSPWLDLLWGSCLFVIAIYGWLALI
jgi:hypothetical protein